MTLGHSAPNKNTRDVISNGISDSRNPRLLRLSLCPINVNIFILGTAILAMFIKISGCLGQSQLKVRIPFEYDN